MAEKTNTHTHTEMRIRTEREIIKDGCKGREEREEPRRRILDLDPLEPCISDPDVVSRVINYDVRPRRRACRVSRNYSTVSAGLPVKNTKGGMIYNRSCFLCIECLPHRARAGSKKWKESGRVRRDTRFPIPRSETREYRENDIVRCDKLPDRTSIRWLNLVRAVSQSLAAYSISSMFLFFNLTVISR